MLLIIRAATTGDLPALTTIYNDAVADTTAIWNDRQVDIENRRLWLEDRTGQGFPVLVAADGTETVGYATFGPFRPHDGYRHSVENSIYVAKKKRGQGIAAALMPPLLDAAKALGVHAMIAGIEAENHASIRLHEKFGFREVGRLPEVGRKFDRWLDLVFMQKTFVD
jgi:phosphinothricin acetyltransferase